MSQNRPYILTIAGFDPSAGAGVLADIKTFEQLKVYGLAVITANTIQTETEFYELEWISKEFTMQSLQLLLQHYSVEAIKIGIVPSIDFLSELVITIKKHTPKAKIVWDTVLKSSTEFQFLQLSKQDELLSVLNQIDIITPNYNEILKLSSNSNNPLEIAKELSNYCAVYLKGGHNEEDKGTDYLLTKGNITTLKPTEVLLFEKHGSGCILSSAITSYLALGETVETACAKGKTYIEKILKSNTNLLSYHHVS